MKRLLSFFFFFFFNDTATTEIYTLSLHDALPICCCRAPQPQLAGNAGTGTPAPIEQANPPYLRQRSEEHTSELQSRLHLVCRLLLEKKKKQLNNTAYYNTHAKSSPLLQHTCHTVS